MYSKLSLTIIVAFIGYIANAQCFYVPSTSIPTNLLSYNFSGGAFESYGCAPIDPTYWISGSGTSVLITFVSPQSYPSFRVWGMNDDDVASVSVNNVSYPLTSLSASYAQKVICGPSPGPDGVIFLGGNLVGANSNSTTNYSYQDVSLNVVNVTTIEITGISGLGWGFAGVSVNCPQITGFTANVGLCDPATNTFSLNGTLSISNSPASGTLTITSDCGNTSQTFDPPFSNNINYDFSGITSNGSSCIVFATFSLNPEINSQVEYVAPINCEPLACNFTAINSTSGPCETATGTYSIIGNVSFTNPPATGQLTLTTSGGQQTVLNAPFGTNQNFTISNIPADGTANVTVTATFSAASLCTITNIPFNEPLCQCFITNFSVNQTLCDPTANTYNISGFVDFISAPTTGQLIVETCGGIQAIFNAPFTSPTAYAIGNLTPDNTNCAINAYFTADLVCSSNIVIVAPPPCSCAADAGTFTANITGDSQNNYILCFGDQININTNNDFTYPDFNANAAVAFNPDIWFLVYTCLPSVGPPNDVNNDACLAGVAQQTPNLIDVNDLSFINSFPAGTFTNNTVFYVPITMYDVTTSTYSSTNDNLNCYDLGQVFTVTYLPEITSSIVENCSEGTVSVTIYGGFPQIFGTLFSISNLQPATANLNFTTVTNGGTLTISNLQDADVYSFDVTDANGCPLTISGGPFVGGADISMSTAGPFCFSDPAVQLVATPAGGTWAGFGVSSTGLFNPNLSGNGNINLSYSVTTNCTVTENITVVVNPQASAIINSVGTQCSANAPFQLTAASLGGTWSGNGITNVNTGTFSPVTAGVGIHTITYTITGVCGDIQTTNITVLQSADATFALAGPFCESSADFTLVSNQTGGVWSGSGITSATIGTFSPTAANVGNNAITYTISGVCGDTETQPITVQATANTTINPAGPFCINAVPAQLTAATVGGIWSGPGITNSTDGLFNPQVAGPGLHIISYAIVGNCGNASTLNIDVTTPPFIDFAITDSAGCSPLAFSLVNQSIPTGNNCVWLINNDTISTSCSTFYTVLEDVGAYSVTLTTSAALGCTATLTRDSFIVIYPDPIANFYYTPKETTFVNPLIDFINLSELATAYSWRIDGIFNSVNQDISYRFPYVADTSYAVCLAAISENGCKDTLCEDIFIKGEFLVFIPKAFTPNNDGVNDGFKPIVSGHDPASYEFTVFNRWGELLFASTKNEEAWDGIINGRIVQQDMYVWHLKVRPFPSGEGKEFYGTVMSLKND